MKIFAFFALLFLSLWLLYIVLSDEDDSFLVLKASAQTYNGPALVEGYWLETVNANGKVTHREFVQVPDATKPKATLHKVPCEDRPNCFIGNPTAKQAARAQAAHYKADYGYAEKHTDKAAMEFRAKEKRGELMAATKKKPLASTPLRIKVGNTPIWTCGPGYTHQVKNGQHVCAVGK